MKRGCLVFLLILTAAAWSSAQGLGDAAARERQKRRQQPDPAPQRVFTEADLKPKTPDGEAAEATESTEATVVPTAAEASDPALAELERERQERKLQEAEWRVRFANAREQLALAEAACWHEVVRTEFYQGIPVQMKVKEFVESEEFRRAKQALADLEEQFRRTGLPPGWTREP
jgi:hypothetical protein